MNSVEQNYYGQANSLSHTRGFSSFVEHERSLPRSKQPFAGSRMHSNETVDIIPSNVSRIRFNNTLSYTPWSSHRFLLCVILDNDHLDTHLLYFTIRLLKSSTCFEHYMFIIRRLNRIDAASGIVTLSQWPYGAQVERVQVC